MDEVTICEDDKKELYALASYSSSKYCAAAVSKSAGGRQKIK